MVKRRDKYNKLIWLDSLPSDPTNGYLDMPLSLAPSMHTSLDTLVRPLRLWVEVEQDGEIYKVRTYPRLGHSPFGHNRISTSHAGRSIHALLAQAVRDHDTYNAAPGSATLSPRERVRWVA